MGSGGNWTFLSNHAMVLLCIAKEPDIRLRDMAERVGITERAVQRIIADLKEGGYLSKSREGRRNHYQIHPERRLRHLIVADHEVSELVGLIRSPAEK